MINKDQGRKKKEKRKKRIVEMLNVKKISAQWFIL